MQNLKKKKVAITVAHLDNRNMEVLIPKKCFLIVRKGSNSIKNLLEISLIPKDALNNMQ